MLTGSPRNSTLSAADTHTSNGNSTAVSKPTTPSNTDTITRFFNGNCSVARVNVAPSLRSARKR